MDIKKELSLNRTLLLLVSSLEYNNVILDTVRQLSGNSIFYVALNKTFDSLKENFANHGINIGNIIFIDAISNTIKKTVKQTKNCYFVNSPGSLTEISLTISKLLKHDFEYLIFDSLTSLLVYEKRAPVGKFISTIVNKIKDSKTKAVFYALSIREQEALIKESSMFVDKVIDLGLTSNK